VLPHHSEIEVRPVFSHEIDTATLTVDGQEGFELGPGDRVVTKRSPHDAHIAASPFRNHFEILHAKLNWGDR
jgi:NAD kinase